MHPTAAALRLLLSLRLAPLPLLFPPSLTALSVPQARRPVLQGGHRALPQLQCPPVCRAQRPHALPGLADRRGAEQLLHLDGEVPPAARSLIFIRLCARGAKVLSALESYS